MPTTGAFGSMCKPTRACSARLFSARAASRGDDSAAEQLRDNERAFDAQARALGGLPDSEEVRLELEDFAERANAWPKLADVYAKVAAGPTDSAPASSAASRLATSWSSRSGLGPR